MPYGNRHHRGSRPPDPAGDRFLTASRAQETRSRRDNHNNPTLNTNTSLGPSNGPSLAIRTTSARGHGGSNLGFGSGLQRARPLGGRIDSETEDGGSFHGALDDVNNSASQSASVQPVQQDNEHTASTSSTSTARNLAVAPPAAPSSGKRTTRSSIKMTNEPPKPKKRASNAKDPIKRLVTNKNLRRLLSNKRPERVVKRNDGMLLRLGGRYPPGLRGLEMVPEDSTDE